MPIIEFKCADNHVTEKVIISRAEADSATTTKCQAVVKETSAATFLCGKTAKRILSTSVAHFVAGVGGFDKPSFGAVPTTHSRSGAEEFIKENMKTESGGKRITKRGTFSRGKGKQ